MPSKAKLKLKIKLLKLQIEHLKTEVISNSFKITDPNNPDSYIEMIYVDGKFSTNTVTIQPNIIDNITNHK